jgi:hypothetical protein
MLAMWPVWRAEAAPFAGFAEALDFLQKEGGKLIAEAKLAQKGFVASERPFQILIGGAMRETRSEQVAAGHAEASRQALCAALLNYQATIAERGDRDGSGLATRKAASRAQVLVELRGFASFELQHRVFSTAENVDGYTEFHGAPLRDLSYQTPSGSATRLCEMGAPRFRKNALAGENLECNPNYLLVSSATAR